MQWLPAKGSRFAGISSSVASHLMNPSPTKGIVFAGLPSSVASRLRPLALFGFCWCVAISAALGTVSCKRHASSGQATAEALASATQLPPLVVRDDTKDLLLTWIDNAGDFHVVQTLTEVPTDAKERVRVVVTTNDAGNSDPVYVADLRQKNADASYSVTTMARNAWEELGAAKRKARIEALAPVAAPPTSNRSPTAAAETAKLAIIYGAKWCGACRQAKKYLAQKGVKVLEKDVDESATVQAELRSKLTKAGMPPTSSIPIIDIGGRILVGFSQGAVDAALQALK
jgi:glutaredoxin